MELLIRVWDWRVGAVTWLLVVAATAVAGFIGGTLIAMLNRGIRGGLSASGNLIVTFFRDRSEERRVGKECRL